MSETRVLAEAHWEYTRKIINDVLELTKTAYVEAFIHGIKHGREAEGGTP